MKNFFNLADIVAKEGKQKTTTVICEATEILYRAHRNNRFPTYEHVLSSLKKHYIKELENYKK